MTTNTAKRFGTVAVSAIAVTSMMGGAAVGFAATAPDAEDTQAAAAQTVEDAAVVAVDKVEGTFAFNQTDLSSISEIRRAIGQSARYLCGSQFGFDNADVTDAREWRLAIGGSVDEAWAGTVGELTDTVGEVRIAMGCACMGNPVGGFATISAEVTGVSIRSIMELVQPASGTNTVVFTSSDGYEVALPLAYVYSRPSVVAYAINGATMEEASGGTNQLWVGTTAAKYYARDVVKITFEQREVAPPTPGTPEAGDMYANAPAIGVTKGDVA